MKRNLHTSPHSPLWKLRRSLETKATIEKNLSGGVESRHAGNSARNRPIPSLASKDAPVGVECSNVPAPRRSHVTEPVVRPSDSGSSAPSAQLLLIDGLIARCNAAPSLRRHLLRERAELTEPKEAA
jgi:hypothetical protein